jgi:hypothetical protein
MRELDLPAALWAAAQETGLWICYISFGPARAWVLLPRTMSCWPPFTRMSQPGPESSRVVSELDSLAHVGVLSGTLYLAILPEKDPSRSRTRSPLGAGPAGKSVSAFAGFMERKTAGESGSAGL